MNTRPEPMTAFSCTEQNPRHAKIKLSRYFISLVPSLLNYKCNRLMRVFRGNYPIPNQHRLSASPTDENTTPGP